MILANENFQIQKRLTFITVALFAVKLTAWYVTHSVAILTDALEYTINVIAGFISLYSLYISAKPKDENHPYGHGKVEFLSAAIEGILMIVSSFLIIYEAIYNLKHPHSLNGLDYGIYLVALTAIINYGAGYYAIQRGKKNNSLALLATGKHLQSDTYATGGVILALIIMYFTRYTWIDSVVAMAFAFVIIVTGYKILRSSIAGIMDEADKELLAKVVNYLNAKRRENWMDIHNLRIIKYGSVLHLDCHLTVPWYFNVKQGHYEVKTLDNMVKDNFGESVELFVHMDDCLYAQCSICMKHDCPVRQQPFVHRLEWTTANILSNQKHTLENVQE